MLRFHEKAVARENVARIEVGDNKERRILSKQEDAMEPVDRDCFQLRRLAWREIGQNSREIDSPFLAQPLRGDLDEQDRRVVIAHRDDEHAVADAVLREARRLTHREVPMIDDAQPFPRHRWFRP